MTSEKVRYLSELTRRTALKGVGAVGLGVAASGTTLAHGDGDTADDGGTSGDGSAGQNGETASDGGGENSGGGSEQDEFVARLRPENAVGPKYRPGPCDAKGGARFTVDGDAEAVAYSLRLSGADGVSGVHLHRGTPGENGPHVANLFDGGPTGAAGEFFDLCADGEITAADFDDAFDGTFADVVDLMRAGETYLQVHLGEAGKAVLRGRLE